MSAPQGPRGVGGRPRAARGRGMTPRGSRGQAGARLTAHNPRRAVVAPSPTTAPASKPPPRNGFRVTSRKPFPSTAYQAQERTFTHTPQMSTSPPPEGGARVSSLGNATLPLQKRMGDLYQKLKKNREQERKDAIKDGFLADPDKPTSLANAITPVGTCQDMCPHFERAERIVQLMVDNAEKSTLSSGPKEPDESKMVKRFRRSAAGYDEQLPSDIRPPLVLQKTLDYLINDVVGGQQPLANIHKFVWDRTRGIRNDFSIQQVTKSEDLRIAINCFERIARFHILSLHQLSQPGNDNGEFDHHQEREQLNNTLLSLMYYYDDSRHKLSSPNEAEFRAYCIIFEIQDQRPDLEDRAQQWPRLLLKDPKVQTALKLYAASGNTSDEQGPLRPRTPFAIAQASIGRFWDLVDSSSVSYIMACVAEIYFDLVRRTTLETIWKAFKGKRGGAARIEDWGVNQLTYMLGFDDERQTQAYVEEHGFSIGEKEDGEYYVDLGSVTSKNLSDTQPRRKQLYSKRLVEAKRLDRTLPAVINGLNASKARFQGLTESTCEAKESAIPQYEPLFITGESDEEAEHHMEPLGIITPRGVKPGPTGSLQPTIIAPSTPACTSINVNTNPFSLRKSTFSENSSIAVPSLAFNTLRSSFGKASFFPSNVTAISPDAAPSVGIFEQNPAPLNESFIELHESKTERNPPEAVRLPFGGAGTPSFGSFKLPRNTAIPSSEPAKPPLNGDSNHALAARIAENDIAKSTSEPPNIQNYMAKEKTSPHTKTLFPTTPHSAESDQLAVVSKPLDAQNTLENPNTVQNSSLTNRTSLSLPDSLSIPPSFTTNRALSAEKEIVPNSVNVLDPQIALTSLAAGQSHPIVSLSELNSGVRGLVQQITPFNNSETISSANPLSVNTPMPQQNLGTVSNINSSNLRRRSAAIHALSEGLMYDDDGLIRQFVEYMVGPVIAASIREIKDERSWKQARLFRSLLLSKKYGRRWMRNAWTAGLLRKGRKRRKIFARSMDELAQGLIERRSGLRPSMGKVGESQPIGHSNRRLSSLPSEALPPRRKSLPADFAEEQLRIRDAATPSNKRKRLESPTEVIASSSRHTKAHNKGSKALAQPMVSPRVEGRAVDYKRNSASRRDSTFSQLSSVRKLGALLSGRTDTTRTDYFRLKALGVDPDTPLVPHPAKRRNLADIKNIEEQAKTSLSSRQGARSSSSRGTRTSRETNSVEVKQPQATCERDDDSDETLLAQMRSVRKTMSESISWFREEGTRGQLASSRGEEQASTETGKEKRLSAITSTPSRTEQRLRQTGAHGLLAKEWNLQSSWSNEHGRVSLLTTSPCSSDVGAAAASPHSESRAASPAFGLAAARIGTKNINGSGTSKGTRAKANGLSAEDAIEL